MRTRDSVLPLSTATPLDWSGYTVSTETGYSATLSGQGRLAVTVPTGTTRADPTVAGVRILVPMRRPDGSAALLAEYPAGRVTVAFTSGLANGGDTGIMVWSGIAGKTDLSTASGGGAVVSDQASMTAGAWHIGSGTYSEGTLSAADSDMMHASWHWGSAVDKRLGSIGFRMTKAGAYVLGGPRSPAGAMAGPNVYVAICVGLSAAAKAGGSIVLNVSTSIT